MFDFTVMHLNLFTEGGHFICMSHYGAGNMSHGGKFLFRNFPEPQAGKSADPRVPLIHVP